MNDFIVKVEKLNLCILCHLSTVLHNYISVVILKQQPSFPVQPFRCHVDIEGEFYANDLFIPLCEFEHGFLPVFYHRRSVYRFIEKIINGVSVRCLKLIVPTPKVTPPPFFS